MTLAASHPPTVPLSSAWSALPPEYPAYVIALQSGHRRPAPFVPAPDQEGGK